MLSMFLCGLFPAIPQRRIVSTNCWIVAYKKRAAGMMNVRTAGQWPVSGCCLVTLWPSIYSTLRSLLLNIWEWIIEIAQPVSCNFLHNSTLCVQGHGQPSRSWKATVLLFYMIKPIYIYARCLKTNSILYRFPLCKCCINSNGMVSKNVSLLMC